MMAVERERKEDLWRDAVVDQSRNVGEFKLPVIMGVWWRRFAREIVAGPLRTKAASGRRTGPKCWRN